MSTPHGAGNIPIVCPGCGLKFPAVAGILDVDARRALDRVCGSREHPGLPPQILMRLVAYLGLHAPAGKAVQWRKVTSLLEGLHRLVGLPSLRHDHGPARVVTAEHWAAAMDEAERQAQLGKLDLPLDGHGWITAVAYSLASKAEAAAERQAEARARGETPVGEHPSHKPVEPTHRRRAVRTEAVDGQLTSMKDLLGRGLATTQPQQPTINNED